MLIKITDKCSMGCTHCLSDCKPDGKHMSFETFKKVITFHFDRAGNSPILISGGEPTEHPEFEKFIGYLLTYKLLSEASKLTKLPPITVTTNGRWLVSNMNFVKYLENASHTCNEIMFQVVIDDRYYPTHVDEEVLSSSKMIVVFSLFTKSISELINLTESPPKSLSATVATELFVIIAYSFKAKTLF